MSDIKRCMVCNNTQSVYSDPTACAGCGNPNQWVEVPDEDFAPPAPALVQSVAADVMAPALVQSERRGKGRR